MNIKPITITDKTTDTQYTLEFDKKTVKFAEENGFVLSDVSRKPFTGIADLFFYAFRLHHRFVKKEQTDELLERLRPFPDGFVEKLIQLYGAPFAGKEEADPFLTIDM